MHLAFKNLYLNFVESMSDFGIFVMQDALVWLCCNFSSAWMKGNGLNHS